MNVQKINVRGVSFANVTMAEAVAFIRENMENGIPTAVHTPNSEIVQNCIDNPKLYSLINSAELIIPDGIGVIMASKILGSPLKEKVAGYDLGLEIMKYADETEKKVFLFGGADETRCDFGVSIADKCVEVMHKKHPHVNFVGTRHGYFKKDGEENDETVRIINESGAEIVYVCLGSPAQEKWIAENREKLPGVKLYLALGGSLDGYTGNVKRAPKIFIKLGLEWFYRLLCQPSRFFRMLSLPKFYFGTWIYKFKRK